MSNDEQQMIEEEIIQDYYGHSHFPLINEYVKKYANSNEGNDRKAVSYFVDYETMENQRRLERELIEIKKENGSKAALRKILGKRREASYNGFPRWAHCMLIWLVEARR